MLPSFKKKSDNDSYCDSSVLDAENMISECDAEYNKYHPEAVLGWQVAMEEHLITNDGSYKL